MADTSGGRSIARIAVGILVILIFSGWVIVHPDELSIVMAAVALIVAAGLFVTKFD